MQAQAANGAMGESERWAFPGAIGNENLRNDLDAGRGPLEKG